MATSTSELPVSVPAKASRKRRASVANSALITDGKALEAFCAETAGLYATVSTRVHIAVISSIYFAAVHGRTDALDLIFNALDSNHQSAVKLYIRRYAAELGLGSKPEGFAPVVIQEAVKSAGFLKHRSKPNQGENNWIVISGKSEQRKLWVKLINDRLAQPDMENDFPVLYRNNFAETSILSDKEAYEGVIRAAKRVLQPSERVDVEKVSSVTNKWLQKILDEATDMRDKVVTANSR